MFDNLVESTGDHKDARRGVFFVATAPSRPEGHLNVSPKGLDTLREALA